MMTSTSRTSMNAEREVVKNEKDVIMPFELDYSNIDDPLADATDTDDVYKSSKKEIIRVKDEDAEEGGGRQLRSHSNTSGNVIHVKHHKVFVIETQTSKQIGGQRKGGRQRKYSTLEEKRKARAEQQRQRRANMSEEKRKEFLLKQREFIRQRRTKMKEEAEVSRKETADPDPSPVEKYEERKRKMREYHRRRKKENPEKHNEMKEKQREANKRWKERNPEKYLKKVERQRERNKARSAMRKKIEETEEEKELKRVKKRLWYRKQMETEEGREMIRFRQFSRVQMKLAQMTDEERKAWTAKNTEAARKWRYNLTGEKLQRYREYTRQKSKKNSQNEEFVKRQRERVKVYCRQRCAQETPEERQKRLRRYKIYQAMCKLRKQLKEIGVPQEEVERRVTELKSEMQAEPLPLPEPLSTYKPRIKSEVNYTPRQYQGKRRGRPPGGSRKTLHRNQVDTNSKSQTGMCSPEIDDSNHRHFDDDGFQCDPVFNGGTSNQIKADPNEETTTTLEPETVPILRFDINCPHCSSTYSERSDLISHISSEHSEICWKCPKCKLIVLSSDELSDHYKRKHFPTSKGSTDTTTTTPNSTRRETSSRTTENKFTCIKCDSQDSDRTFESVKDLMEHVKSSHPQSFWPCSKCNLLKYTESSLKIHEKICKRTRRPAKQNGRKRLMRNK